MTYIRLDYAVTFFIIYIIISMVREMYGNYKLKLKPTDYDSGYRQAIRDLAYKFNSIKDLRLSDRDFLIKFRDYLQDKLNGGG
jgi:hypothetical protein